ncbi:MAG: formate dehydrogenase accessory sulfurtransferase FdhD [Gemmatimonadetes bacterium]|nr:MAG: formate dehydrogenase accessory sulfurtransferase FdhD [Gemmatimonadota bacterium]
MEPRRGVQALRVERVREGRAGTRRDVVAVEEPLEIRLEWAEGGEVRTEAVSVTMRTPGHDFELAAGFLFAEGVIGARDEVQDLRYCASEGPQHYNVVAVRLRDGVVFDPGGLRRNFTMNSSCGVCGKANLEALELRGCTPLRPEDGPHIDRALVPLLPDRLRGEQGLFERTGGLHAAGLFGADGDPVCVREDVGRHNAVDKVVGRLLLDGRLPADALALVVSGRTSFEILQKALAARVPVVVAVGAPSSLAVDLARSFGITLVGFARDGGYNVYAGGERLR